MKYWVFLCLLAVALGMQLFLPQLLPLTRYIDFPLLLVFYTARISSPRRTVLQSWLTGLAQDLSLSSLYPLGLQGISKMTVGTLTGFLSRHLNTEPLWIQMLILFGMALLNNWLVVLLFAVFGQQAPVNTAYPVIFSAAATTVCYVPVHFLRYRGIKAVSPDST
ncbi:MAG: rod shape-determining protein MreD [Acidobacteria bacterium]|nr:rod shape-determining protein MreD [Acidobacteriota bacterium]